MLWQQQSLRLHPTYTHSKHCVISCLSCIKLPEQCMAGNKLVADGPWQCQCKLVTVTLVSQRFLMASRGFRNNFLNIPDDVLCMHVCNLCIMEGDALHVLVNWTCELVSHCLAGCGEPQPTATTPKMPLGAFWLWDSVKNIYLSTVFHT